MTVSRTHTSHLRAGAHLAFEGTIGKERMFFDVHDAHKLGTLRADESIGDAAMRLRLSVVPRREVERSVVRQVTRAWGAARLGKPARLSNRKH